jgi:MFS family permease
MSVATGPDAGLRMGTPRARWVLFTTVLGSSLAMLDATVVNVALDRIGTDLDADFAGLQWTVNAYTLTLAAFILLGGSLSDRFGRRRVFVVGVCWFAVASLLCGLAPNVGTLIAARALQGVGVGLTLLVAPLTATVLESAADRFAGVASGVDNAAARSAGLLAVAVVPVLAGISGADYTEPAAFSDGFGTALLICAGLLVLAGLLAAALIRRPVSAVPDSPSARIRIEECLTCSVSAPPMHRTAQQGQATTR